MVDNPLIFFICYAVSGFLDAIDGHAARALNQSKWNFPVINDLIIGCLQSHDQKLVQSQSDTILQDFQIQKSVRTENRTDKHC